MLGRVIHGTGESEPSDLVTVLLAAAQSEPRPRVLTITGPPQSGKSRTLAEFVRRCGVNAFTVPLTEEDTTLFAFVFALVHSMGPIARGAQLSFNAVHARLSTPNPIPQLVTWLCAHIGADAWIAVDNVELLEAQSQVSQFLLAMAERCPRVRWLFAGRRLDAFPGAAASFETVAIAALPVHDVLARLDATERELLASVAPLRALEPRLIAAILGEAGTLLVRRLYERLPVLFEVDVSVRLHRDVRRELLTGLQATGSTALQSAVARCGAALEAYEFYEELLQMYLRNGTHGALEEVMARRGLVLADHVNADTLDAALRAVSSESPGVRSLQAILASRRGQYDLAETLFESAARMARHPLAAQIEYAYGCDLLRRKRTDCAPIFEHLLSGNVPGAPHQSEIRSALAQAYVLCEKPAAALEQIKFALHVSPDGSDSSIVKTRAAYVYFHAAQDLALAERIASEALAQALQTRTYAVAVGAASLVYDLACERDRPREAIAALNLLADCGIKLGNVGFQSYAVIAMLEYHVEAGNLAQIAHDVGTLRSFDISCESLEASEALVAAEAMQRSWRGEFESAYKLLEPAAAHAAGEDHRALREAQLGFFAAGAHRNVAAREHARRASRLLDLIDPSTHKAVRARILLALAKSALGDVAGAEDQFACCAESAARFPRLAAVRDGAVLIHRWIQGDANAAALSESFALMHRRGAGGFAMMLDEFPRPSPRFDAFASTNRRRLTARPASS